MNSLRRLFVVLLLALAPLVCFAGATSQSPEIMALITSVSHARGVIFIRNGSEHSASEAATHLRRKLAATHGRIGTAEQFIDALGTRSSFTGVAYRVRLPDGRTIDSAIWLRQLLRDIRNAPAAPAPTQSTTAPPQMAQ